MTMEEFVYFEKMPEMLSVYKVLRNQLEQRYADDFSVKVTKTQISFRNRYVFAMASLPYRKIKGWPKEYLLVSFGLSYKKEALRIAQCVEAYPNRWTHHVLIQNEAEIDDELMGWIDEAFQFSAVK